MSSPSIDWSRRRQLAQKIATVLRKRAEVAQRQFKERVARVYEGNLKPMLGRGPPAFGAEPSAEQRAACARIRKVLGIEIEPRRRRRAAMA